MSAIAAKIACDLLGRHKDSGIEWAGREGKYVGTLCASCEQAIVPFGNFTLVIHADASTDEIHQGYKEMQSQTKRGVAR